MRCLMWDDEFSIVLLHSVTPEDKNELIYMGNQSLAGVELAFIMIQKHKHTSPIVLWSG